MKTRFNKVLGFIPLISNKTKITISISLLAFACILYFMNHSYVQLLCLIGMAFSFIGDIALNSMPLEKRPHSMLYIGALFFICTHLMYALAYYTRITTQSDKYFNLGAILAVLFVVALIAITIIKFVLSSKKTKHMTFIVFGVYSFIITLNFMTICSYSYSAHSIAFIGAISFLISDYIIGIETLFKIKNDTLRKLVWIFYPIGQILILACC